MKEDRILIEQINRSSRRAFKVLYDKYAGMVFNFVLSILKDSYLSEDITQFCFTQLWLKRETLDMDGNVPAWLYVTARNAVYKEVRRQVAASRYADALASSVESPEETPASLDLEKIAEEAKAAVAALPPSRREIYLMRFVDGKTVREISAELGISPKTVETQIARARCSIRARISELLALAALISLSGF